MFLLLRIGIVKFTCTLKLAHILPFLRVERNLAEVCGAVIQHDLMRLPLVGGNGRIIVRGAQELRL